MPDSLAFRHLKTLYEGKEGYTLTSILLVVKREHPKRSHCLWPRWIHPKRMEEERGNRVSVSVLSAGVYTATLYVMVIA